MKKAINLMKKFTQSQSHGLFWDSEIRVKCFGLPVCINDTSKYDICSENNKFDSEENISIKTSSNNNIDCGDILRFYSGDFDKKYTIILVRYKQIENKKLLNTIIEINYNVKLRNILFGTLSKRMLQGYVNFIKNIPHGSVLEPTKKNYKNCKNKMQREFNMRINISPKVDSHSQRRVQCSIPKLDELLESYPEFVISRTNEPIVRGIKITKEIESEPRIRN